MKTGKIIPLFIPMAFVALYTGAASSASDLGINKDTIHISTLFFLAGIFPWFICKPFFDWGSPKIIEKYITLFSNKYIRNSILVYPAIFSAIVLLALFRGDFSGRTDVYEFIEDSIPIIFRYILFILQPISFYAAAILLVNRKFGLASFYIVAILFFALSTLSRSVLSNFIYIFIVLSFTLRISILKPLVFSLFFIFLAALLTNLQGYSSEIDIFSPIKTLFLYMGFSFGLAEIIIKTRSDIDHILFPFFGFLSEKPISYFFDLQNQIDSDFVTKFIDISGYKANVLYPLWSFFFASFGYFGLILFLTISFLLIYFSKKNKLLLLYIFFTISIFTPYRHPLLTSEGVLTVFAIIAIEYLANRSLSKQPRLQAGNSP